MNNRILYIVILTLFILQGIIHPFERSVANHILNWTLTLSSFYFIIYGLVKTFQQKFNEALLAIVSGFILLSALLKLWFFYYNIYLNWLVLGFSSLVILFLYYRKKVKLNDLVLPISFLVLASMFNSLPDLTVLKYVNESKSYAKLKWTDFQGREDMHTTYDAEIRTGISYKINYLSNPTRYLVFAGMLPEQSWKKKSLYKEVLPDLLNHEQRHFDLVKVYEEKIKDSLNSVNFNPELYKDIIVYFFKEEGKISAEYDKFTAHGSDYLKQKVWDSKIDSLLEGQNVLLFSGKDSRFKKLQKEAIKQAEICVAINNKISEKFNLRNEAVVLFNLERKTNEKVEPEIFMTIDSLNKEMKMLLQDAAREIKRNSYRVSDQELYEATSHLVKQFTELEITFSAFFRSLQESDSGREEFLSVPLREKALGIQSEQLKWIEKKEDFYLTYKISSRDLNLREKD